MKNDYRSAARKLAVQMMYQADMTEDEPACVIDTFWKSVKKPEDKISELAETLFRGANERKAASDETVARFLKKDWALDRLSCTVRNILRLAVYELIETKTPSFAVLKEYVNLASAFDDEKTAVFVNGLLEKVRLDFNAEG
jgi:N utilization substance protein B